jgi:hypothetical protein
VITRVGRASRWIQGGIYVLLILAGVVGLISPPPSATFTDPEWPNTIRFAFLVIGGALSLIAVTTDRPFYEQLGLPMIMGGTTIYAAALVWKMFSSQVASVSGTIVIVCLILASGGWVLERYRTVNYLFRDGGDDSDDS